MNKPIILMGCAVLLAAPLIHPPLAHAATGDHLIILAQGVPGAPAGGPTGTGGNAGVNDQGAGTDRSQSYDSSMSNHSTNNNTPNGDDSGRHHRPNSINSTTSGDSGTGNAGNGMPRNGNSY